MLIVFFVAMVASAGILPASRGGTGANLVPVAGGMVSTTSSAFNVVPAGTPNQILISNGTSAPTWGSTIIIPSGSTVVLGSQAATSAYHAPLYIPSGSTLVTPEKGAIESNGTHIWWTDSSGVRHILDNTGAP